MARNASAQVALAPCTARITLRQPRYYERAISGRHATLTAGQAPAGRPNHSSCPPAFRESVPAAVSRVISARL